MKVDEKSRGLTYAMMSGRLRVDPYAVQSILRTEILAVEKDIFENGRDLLLRAFEVSEGAPTEADLFGSNT